MKQFLREFPCFVFRKLVFLAALFVLGVLTVAVTDVVWRPKKTQGEHVTAIVRAKKEKSYRVLKVIDGDTLVIRYQKKSTKVRLIGVDTPESKHPVKTKNVSWGKKAGGYVKSLLKGKKITLSFDKEKYDKYHRLLAYVYFTQKGKRQMLNKHLVKCGYARAVCFEPNHKYKKTLEKLQYQAWKKKKGFWKDGYTAAFPK